MSSDDYARRANAHRPKTPAELRDAARRMAQDGHGDHTIAHVLGLDVAAVRRLIGCGDCGE